MKRKRTTRKIARIGIEVLFISMILAVIVLSIFAVAWERDKRNHHFDAVETRIILMCSRVETDACRNGTALSNLMP